MWDEVDPEVERFKASVTVQLGRVVLDLARAVRTTTGLYESLQAHRSYRALRYEIILAGEAQEDVLTDAVLSEVHTILKWDWPAALYFSRYEDDEIDWIEARDPDVHEEEETAKERRVWRSWIEDFDSSVEKLREAIHEAYAALDFVDLPLNDELLQLARQGSDVARRVEAEKHDYLQALQGESASLISSFSVEAAEEDFDFTFVTDERVRQALTERLQHTYQAFRNRLYGLSAVAGNSVTEAMLVYALKEHVADAAIEYDRLVKEKRLRPHSGDPEYPKKIERWNSHELLVVAKALGVPVDSHLFGLLKRSAKARNGIHLYKLINDDTELDYAEATLILSVAHQVVRIVRTWLEQPTD